jgi:integrase/recombinase XerD
MNRRVSVWKYIKIGSNWRYCRPAYSPNHKIRPDWVLVNSHEEHHPEGNYYLRLSANGGSWKKIGPKPGDAVRAAEYEESLLSAIAMGIPVKVEESAPLGIGASLYGFLQDYKLSNRAESYNLMKQTLEEFAKFVKTTEVSRITRRNLLEYKDWLQVRPAREGKRNSLRTSCNKMLRVNQFLRTVLKQNEGEGLVTVKDGKFVEKEPEVFTDAELDRFFKECLWWKGGAQGYYRQPFYEFVFKTYLMSGLRKQELENLEWPDVDFDKSTLKVSAKPGFNPKTWEERTVEVPAVLMEYFRQAWNEALLRFDRDHVQRLVFPNRKGNKYTHSWDDCVAIAAKAHVVNAHPHKFRATYATKLLQSGVDLKTVQKLLGHKNLESTMRYLAKAQSAQVLAKVEAVFPKKDAPAASG